MEDTKRIDKLEKITQRLMRRATKKKVALITPFPISNAVFGDNISGVILRYLFPCDGEIIKGCVVLNSKPKKPVPFTLRTFSDEGGRSATFVAGNKKTFFEPNMQVASGDKVEISVSPEGETVITELWMSFLWKPSVKDVYAKSYLIEDMENDLLEEQ
jgi:hypothetical protein